MGLPVQFFIRSVWRTQHRPIVEVSAEDSEDVDVAEAAVIVVVDAAVVVVVDYIQSWALLELSRTFDEFCGYLSLGCCVGACPAVVVVPICDSVPSHVSSNKRPVIAVVPV